MHLCSWIGNTSGILAGALMLWLFAAPASAGCSKGVFVVTSGILLTGCLSVISFLFYQTKYFLKSGKKCYNPCMDISIRKATVNDLEEILKLNKALFDYEEKFNSEYNLEWTYSEKGQAYFKKRIARDSSIVLVAEVKTKIVGYLLIFVDSHSIRKINPIAEIENMFISEEYRAHGVGTELMREAIKQVREKGAKNLEVEVEAQNSGAINFYKSNGFEDFEVTLQLKLD